MFGSYDQGEQQPDSDLKITVMFEELVTLFDLIRLEEELTRRLNITVELIIGGSLKPRAAARVAEDIVYI